MRGYSYKQEQISKQDAVHRTLSPIYIKVYRIQRHKQCVDSSGALMW